MCGITGFNWEDRVLIKKINRLISHRGPDDEGYFTNHGVSLGHRRLKIVDLTEKGRQPLSNEEQDIWITFNGEIYNYLELRAKLEQQGHQFSSRTDTEVIVHLYEQYGEKCLQYLNGMFAFAIWDNNKNRFFLARDRFGKKPLYYTLQDGRFIFASEIKSILATDLVKRELNREALNTYLTFRANTDAETFFKGIYKLKPGHYLTFDQINGLQETKYWSLEINVQQKSLAYYEKMIQTELTASIQRRLMGEVPLGVFLSGGIDSASVVALLHSFAKDRIKTFSVGFGYEEQQQEMHNANLIAEHFQTDHHQLTVKPDTIKLMPKIIYHQDEPMADPTAIPTYLLSEFTKRKGVTIVLTGEGSDEIFCGYEQYKLMKLYQRLKLMPRTLRRIGPLLAHGTPNPLLNKIFPYAQRLGKKGIDRFGNYLLARKPIDAYLAVNSIFDEKEKAELLNHQKFSYSLPLKLQADYLNDARKINSQGNAPEKNDLLHPLMRLEVNTALVEDLLMKVDKNAMAHAIEARVPFLDYTFVEKVYQIPIEYKMKGFTEKFILRRAMKPYLPAETIAAKKKRFFVPIDHWLDQDLKESVQQLLDPEEMRRDQIFNPDYLQKIQAGLKDSKLFYTRQLWCLLNFKLWYDTFLLDQQTKKMGSQN